MEGPRLTHSNHLHVAVLQISLQRLGLVDNTDLVITTVVEVIMVGDDLLAVVLLVQRWCRHCVLSLTEWSRVSGDGTTKFTIDSREMEGRENGGRVETERKRGTLGGGSYVMYRLAIPAELSLFATCSAGVLWATHESCSKPPGRGVYNPR